MKSRVWMPRGLPAFTVVLVAAVIISVFLAGSSGVKSASSVARIPIPSEQAVHLDARGYNVSFALYNSPYRGVHVPHLQVSIARSGTGERVELRKPKKRFISSSNSVIVEDQYLIIVPVAGTYDVRVAADEKTDGFLLIGERPIDALARIFKTWVILTVVGFVLCVAIGCGAPTASSLFRSGCALAAARSLPTTTVWGPPADPERADPLRTHPILAPAATLGCFVPQRGDRT